MKRVSDKILRKIIEAGGEQARVKAQMSALAGPLGVEISAALSNHYQTKIAVTPNSCDCRTVGAMAEAAADRLSAYHYKFSGGEDVFLLLDDTGVISSAAWILDGAIPSGQAGEVKVSVIERRLACSLAAHLMNALYEGAIFTGVEGEMARLDIRDTNTVLAIFEFSVQSADDMPLGTFTIAAPEVSLPPPPEQDSEKKDYNKAHWGEGVTRMALNVPIEMRAVLAREVVDYRVLSELSLDQVLPLVGATIEDVELEPTRTHDAPALVYGGIGAHDGARAMKVSAIEF